MGRIFKTKIVSVTGDQYKIVTLLAENYHFECGQYLVVIDRSKKIPLSIASSPIDLPCLRFVFKPEHNNSDSLLLEQLLRQKSIEVSSPKGKVRCPHDNQLLLLVAQGTGISQAIAFIDHLTTQFSNKNIKLLWVNNEEPSLAGAVNFDAWLSQVDSMIIHNEDLSLWLKQNRSSIINANCILTGDRDFVYWTKDKLTQNKIMLNSIQSDVFEYSSP